jgi:hypothetical protein
MVDEATAAALAIEPNAQKPTKRRNLLFIVKLPISTTVEKFSIAPVS